MAGKRAEPPDPEELERSGDSAPGDGSPRDREQLEDLERAYARSGDELVRDERTGPVKIARHVKDDGRALIVYTRDPDAPA
jgi:hypothetical protein